MDEQSGESERKKWRVKEWVCRKWRNWYQNEVDEEIKRIDFRDKVKHEWQKERTHRALFTFGGVIAECVNTVFFAPYFRDRLFAPKITQLMLAMFFILRFFIAFIEV